LSLPSRHKINQSFFGHIDHPENGCHTYLQLANRGPALPGKDLMHFLYIKVFSPVICLGFGVWGTPGSGGQVGGVKLVLRNFPKLVCRSVQNLVEIGPAVCL